MNTTKIFLILLNYELLNVEPCEYDQYDRIKPIHYDNLNRIRHIDIIFYNLKA